jgi:hypothetical protein
LALFSSKALFGLIEFLRNLILRAVEACLSLDEFVRANGEKKHLIG